MTLQQNSSRRRPLAVIAAGMLAAGVVTAGPAAQPAHAAGLTCHGRPATIEGTSGPDTITGTPDDDVIVAGAGDDVIKGGLGDDLICGGPGDDSIVAGPPRTPYEDEDTVYGGSGDDDINGGSKLDHLYGGAGDDHEVGGHGARASDDLYGGPGADLLQSAGLMYGDSGRDRLVGVGNHAAVDFGDGPDPSAVSVDLAGGIASSATTGHDTITHVHIVIGTSGDDRLLGDAAADQMFGQGGDDVMHGRRGRDDLLDDDFCGLGCLSVADLAAGPFGADTLVGGKGNDIFELKGGRDTVRGGPGEDRFVPALIIKAPLTIDLEHHRIRWHAINGRIYGVEDVDGTVRADHIFGNAAANRILASGGADVIRGRAGNDHIDGSTGADTAYGGAGKDHCTSVEHAHSC